MIDGSVKKFLEVSEYCDFDHPKIRELASSLTKDFVEPKQKARVLFYWVRDNIHYRVGLWNKKASETLTERSGSCTNNANLLVALLRSSGIPAAYNVMRVKGKEFFGPITLPSFRDRISERAVHVYVEVYIEGKWIKCDPSTDIYLSEKTAHFNPQSRLVEWDGEHDAFPSIDAAHILSEEVLLSNIDNIISKRPHTARGVIIDVANLYIKFLREGEKLLVHPSRLEPLFMKWLKKNSPRHHYLFVINSTLFKLKGFFRKKII